MGGAIIETRLISVKQAAKLYGFPQQELYRLVANKQVPYIEIQTLSGNKMKKINTKTFEEWLDRLSEENASI
ncbi:helix-turn-helix domain-containing protein [uncultured Tissierella sp.]|uniref:helix-turn-helix domain-containing protein n=1 Tax=uncultured Tissierella sp. TaxID=448160 RepID=UPI0035A7033E